MKAIKSDNMSRGAAADAIELCDVPQLLSDEEERSMDSSMDAMEITARFLKGNLNSSINGLLDDVDIGDGGNVDRRRSATSRVAPYQEGQKVLYAKNSNGNNGEVTSQAAIVTKVHYDDELNPYYTINLNGRERQTDDAHLSAIKGEDSISSSFNSKSSGSGGSVNNSGRRESDGSGNSNSRRGSIIINSGRSSKQRVGNGPKKRSSKTQQLRGNKEDQIDVPNLEDDLLGSFTSQGSGGADAAGGGGGHRRMLEDQIDVPRRGERGPPGRRESAAAGTEVGNGSSVGDRSKGSGKSGHIDWGFGPVDDQSKKSSRKSSSAIVIEDDEKPTARGGRRRRSSAEVGSRKALRDSLRGMGSSKDIWKDEGSATGGDPSTPSQRSSLDVVLGWPASNREGKRGSGIFESVWGGGGNGKTSDDGDSVSQSTEEDGGMSRSMKLMRTISGRVGFMRSNTSSLGNSEDSGSLHNHPPTRYYDGPCKNTINSTRRFVYTHAKFTCLCIILFLALIVAMGTLVVVMPLWMESEERDESGELGGLTYGGSNSDGSDGMVMDSSSKQVQKEEQQFVEPGDTGWTEDHFEPGGFSVDKAGGGNEDKKDIINDVGSSLSSTASPSGKYPLLPHHPPSAEELKNMGPGERLELAEWINHSCSRMRGGGFVISNLGGGGVEESECELLCREKECCFVDEEERHEQPTTVDTNISIQANGLVDAMNLTDEGEGATAIEASNEEIAAAATTTANEGITTSCPDPDPDCVWIESWAPVCHGGSCQYSNPGHAGCAGLTEYSIGECAASAPADSTVDDSLSTRRQHRQLRGEDKRHNRRRVKRRRRLDDEPKLTNVEVIDYANRQNSSTAAIAIGQEEAIVNATTVEGEPTDREKMTPLTISSKEELDVPPLVGETTDAAANLNAAATVTSLKGKNCVNDPMQHCMTYAGCAPLFGKRR